MHGVAPSTHGSTTYASAASEPPSASAVAAAATSAPARLEPLVYRQNPHAGIASDMFALMRQFAKLESCCNLLISLGGHCHLQWHSVVTMSDAKTFAVHHAGHLREPPVLRSRGGFDKNRIPAAPAKAPHTGVQFHRICLTTLPFCC